MVAVSLKKDFFQAEDGIRDVAPSRGLGDVYKRQASAVTGIVGPIGAHPYLYLTGIDNTTHLNTVIICKVILNSHGTVRSISGTLQAVVGTTTPSFFISNFNGTYSSGG